MYEIESWSEETEDEMHYGLMKATAEKEAIMAFGDRALIIRPGLIVGPGDTTVEIGFSLDAWSPAMVQSVAEVQFIKPDTDAPPQIKILRFK